MLGDYNPNYCMVHAVKCMGSEQEGPRDGTARAPPPSARAVGGPGCEGRRLASGALSSR